MEKFIQNISKMPKPQKYYDIYLNFHNSFNNFFNIRNHEETITFLIYLHSYNLNLKSLFFIYSKNIISTQISNERLKKISNGDYIKCFYYEKVDLLYIIINFFGIDKKYITRISLNDDIIFINKILQNKKYKKCIIRINSNCKDNKYKRYNIIYVVKILFNTIKYNIPFIFIDYIFDTSDIFFYLYQTNRFFYIKNYDIIKSKNLLFFYKLIDNIKDRYNTIIHAKYSTINFNTNHVIQLFANTRKQCMPPLKDIISIKSYINYNGDNKYKKLYNKLLYEFFSIIIRLQPI